MRKLFLFFSFASSAIFSIAQSRVAIVGGLHSTSVSPFLNKQSNAIGTTETKKTSLHFGFLANVPFTEGSKLSFQPGVIYSSKAVTHLQTLDTSTTKFYQFTTDQRINYIDIAMNLVLKLPIKGKTKFILGAGPQVSLFYNGSSAISTLDTTDHFTEDKNEDLPVGKDDQKFRVMHFSINGLAGLDFGRVFLTANYSKGLTPFYKQNNESYNYATIGATLGVYLGKTEQSKKPVVDNDRDKDGIINNEDVCPDQPGSIATHGCPDKDGDGIADVTDLCPTEAGTLANNGCPVRDKDNDGIKDDADRCPDIAGTAKYNGCPVPDTDKDGVDDEHDLCITEAGVKANNGCPEVKKEVIEKEVIEKVNLAARQIRFEFRKAELAPQSFKVLDEVVSVLSKNAELKITIEGHTSSDGSFEANMILSQKRADAVKKYLVSRGITNDRITATGYGPSKPLSTESSEEAKAANRRVEMKLSR